MRRMAGHRKLSWTPHSDIPDEKELGPRPPENKVCTRGAESFYSLNLLSDLLKLRVLAWTGSARVPLPCPVAFTPRNFDILPRETSLRLESHWCKKGKAALLVFLRAIDSPKKTNVKSLRIFCAPRTEHAAAELQLTG